jgi:hypothetical protein
MVVVGLAFLTNDLAAAAIIAIEIVAGVQFHH